MYSNAQNTHTDAPPQRDTEHANLLIEIKESLSKLWICVYAGSDIMISWHNWKESCTFKFNLDMLYFLNLI